MWRAGQDRKTRNHEQLIATSQFQQFRASHRADAGIDGNESPQGDATFALSRNPATFD